MRTVPCFSDQLINMNQCYSIKGGFKANDKLLMFPTLSSWFRFCAYFLFSVFLLHPGRFAELLYKTVSEDDILQTSSKYTGKHMQ